VERHDDVIYHEEGKEKKKTLCKEMKEKQKKMTAPEECAFGVEFKQRV